MTGPAEIDPFDALLDDLEEEDSNQRQYNDRFVKLYLDEIPKLLLLLQFKNILSRDLVVLLAMVRLCEIRSGRCRAPAKKIAEDLQMNLNTVFLSIKRLREAQLIVKAYDKRTGEVMYLINPYLFSGCSGKQQGFQIKTYLEAIQRGQEE